MLIASNTLLIVDVPQDNFSQEYIIALKQELQSYGQLKCLVPFKALSRFVIVYSCTIEAIAAKEGLVNFKVYFGQETALDQEIDYLKVPEIEKNFLLSPPGSPPIDWVQARESSPYSGGHVAILDGMETLELDPHDQMDESVNSSRIVLNFSDSMSSSLPMIIVDNYDGEELNQENWMGGGVLKSKKGAIFQQTRLPDYN